MSAVVTTAVTHDLRAIADDGQYRITGDADNAGWLLNLTRDEATQLRDQLTQLLEETPDA